MDGLATAQEQLHVVLRDKIAAARLGDASRLAVLAEQEAPLVKRIQELESMHRGWLVSVAPRVGVDVKVARQMKLSQLWMHLPDDQRRNVTELTNRLRSATARVAEANGVLTRLSRGILHHLAAVFAAVAPRETAHAGYSRQGGAQPVTATATLFEAVG